MKTIHKNDSLERVKSRLELLLSHFKDVIWLCWVEHTAEPNSAGSFVLVWPSRPRLLPSLHQPHCPASLSWVRETPGSFLVTGLQTRGPTTWQNPKFFQKQAPRVQSFQAALEPGGDSGGMHLKGVCASLSQVLRFMHVSGAWVHLADSEKSPSWPLAIIFLQVSHAF